MPVVAAALHARFGLGSMAAEVRRQRLTDRRREDIVLATKVGGGRCAAAWAGKACDARRSPCGVGESFAVPGCRDSER